MTKLEHKTSKKTTNINLLPTHQELIAKYFIVYHKTTISYNVHTKSNKIGLRCIKTKK